MPYNHDMEEMIACCGIDCMECEAWKATASNDNGMRDEVAGKWQQIYSPDIKPDDINCLGCNNGDLVFSFCRSCRLRLCCRQKGHANCAHCPDYPCQISDEYSQFIPKGREKLDLIRAGLK